MQGPRSLKVSPDLRLFLILAGAFVGSAGMLVFALAQIGTLFRGILPRELAWAIMVVASALGIGADLRALHRHGFSFGLSRQTPKVLLHMGQAFWVTPLFWGLDTGSIWSTYRVSFCSWLLLLLAILGLAPEWAGILYGLAFVVPLSMVMYARAPFGGPRVSPPARAQWIGIAAMALLCGSSIWGLAANV